MQQTFELYLQHASGERRFRPVSCQSAVQVMEKARSLLKEEEAVDSVEVRLAGEHLFTLER